MFKSIEELRSYRQSVKQVFNAEKQRVIICGGAGCVSKGANKVYDKFVALMEEKKIDFTLVLEKEPHDKVRVKKTGCHGFCEVGPLVRIEPQGWLYIKVTVDDVDEIIEKTVKNGECVEIIN